MLNANEISELTSEQQELLLLLLAEENVASHSTAITAETNKRDFYPLSFAQRRLWILNQFNPNSAAYNMCGALHLTGQLNITALEKAFNAIVTRHSILRAHVAIKENQPVLIIVPNLTMPFKVIESSNISDLIQNESSIPFELLKGPLLRATLMQVGQEQHVLLFTIHHIISDAWSIQIIFQELNAYYEAFTTNTPLTLPSLPLQVTDFNLWQQDITNSPAFVSSMAYWKTQLKDAESILNLPTDGMRPAIQTNAGAKHSFTLSPLLSKNIKSLSRQLDVSVFMLLLTVFQVWLFRLTGQEDISIGTVTSNRNRKELESLIGMFSNTLVLRAQLLGEVVFTEQVQQTKQNTLNAFNHQDVPFEKLVEELHVQRDLSRHPLFQIMFVFDEKSPPFQLYGQTVEKLAVDSVDAKFDLTLFIEECEHSLQGCFEYNTDLFQQATIQSFVESYLVLLEEIVQAPDQSINAFKMISSPNEQTFLTFKDHSGPAKDYCLHQLFEKWAATTPTEIAIHYQDQQITYQALNERSNQIAHVLIKSGVMKNKTVAIMLETGIDQIAALLGVCKAGGIFVCLDQNYPPVRLKQILAEVKPCCYISDSSSLNLYEEILLASQQEADYQTVICNVAAANIGDIHNPNIELSPTDPVYIVYTSGSTGKPKGILQAHGCSSQYMEWQSNLFAIHPGKRVGQWASITYDASYSEIFGALCFGATLYISNSADRRDPQAIANWLIAEKINAIQLVPSFFSLVLQCFMTQFPQPATDLVDLEYVLLAGERLPVELARTFQNYFKNQARLYNLYGPSEIVLTSQYLIDELPESLTNIPIGHPFTGRQILILDKYNQLCPLRVPGEIYIKSPYLTLGYYKQPDETAKVFMQNPLHNDYPDRVYKTGDRGRWLNTNEIEFLGRHDAQLKIRGSRVEIGEIEATLSQYSAIEESVIVAKYAEDDTPYLVAFVASKEKLTAQLLREFLTDYLPSYMIPTQFVFLPELPHTISGKVDRKLLSTQTYHYQEQTDENSVPANELEQQIASIWKELLNISSVRNDSNFFDIGGHSLLMVKAQLKLNEKLGRNIPLIELFKYPTIKSLASSLAGKQTTNHFTQLGNQRALVRKRLIQKRK